MNKEPAPFRSMFLTRGVGYYDPRWRGTTWVAGHFDPQDVRLLFNEHEQLRWSIFMMQWSIVGWCASYDNGCITTRLNPRRTPGTSMFECYTLTPAYWPRKPYSGR